MDDGDGIAVELGGCEDVECDVGELHDGVCCIGLVISVEFLVRLSSSESKQRACSAEVGQFSEYYLLTW